jgi:Flp pilus assembly protein TadG
MAREAMHAKLPTPISVRRFLRADGGNIAIITALMLPVLIGFCGLAAEAAYWYYRHLNIRDAADIAAYGGAVVHSGGGDEGEVATAVRADAVANGWQESSGSIAVTQSGPRVEVELTESQPRYFSRFWCGTATISISARSVAVGANGGGVKLLPASESGGSKRLRVDTAC